MSFSMMKNFDVIQGIAHQTAIAVENIGYSKPKKKKPMFQLHYCKLHKL